MANTNKALELYRFNELSYPSTSQGLDALVTPHSELKNPFFILKVAIFLQFQKIHGEENISMNIPLDALKNMTIYLRC